MEQILNLPHREAATILTQTRLFFRDMPAVHLDSGTTPNALESNAGQLPQPIGKHS